MLQEIAVLANRYADDINSATDATAKLNKGMWTFQEFQANVIEVSKNRYLDILILDATCVKEEDFLRAVRDIKLHISNKVRVIVLKPNLDDKVILQQLYVYGVYDIVAPEINEQEMTEIEIDSLIVNQIKWAIQEPVEFSSVADDLSVEIITQNITTTIETEPEKPEKKREKVSLNKPRVLCFYHKTAEKFDTFIKDNKYNVVGVLVDSEINQDLSVVDYVLLDNPEIETLSYLKSLAEVNSTPAIIVAGFDNFDAHSNASSIRGVRSFLYDGSANNFKKSAIRAFAEEVKEDTISSRIYAIYGVKGGVGSTTVASLLAKDYAKKHPSARVCVVDYGTRAGDIGVKFGISQPTKNLYQLIEALCKAKKQHLDLSLLKDKVNNYVNYIKKDKLFVLPTTWTDVFSFTNNEYSVSDIAYAYDYVLDCLKDNFDAVFIDVPKYAGFTYETAVQKANKIILVSDAKLASISHLLTKTEELYLYDNVSVIINKEDRRHNESEYENCKLAESKVQDIKYLPVDKKLLKEETEMDIEITSKYKTALRKLNVL